MSGRDPSRYRRPAVLGAALTVGSMFLAGCMATSAAPAVEPTYAGPVRLDEVTVQRFEYPTRYPAPDPEHNWADLYLPAGDQKVDSIPLAVLIHGGSWHKESGAGSFDHLARDLASRGMAVYNIEYRHIGSGGGWPITFRDVADALDHVTEVDRRFPQITTDDEVVVGHSSGAQLAVWAATRHRLEDGEVGSKPSFRPTRAISIAGPLDMTYGATHGDDRIVTLLGGTPDEVSSRYTSVDPIQNIDTGTPVIALHGRQDATVAPENSQRYVDEVDRRGGRAKVVMFEDEDHTSIVSGKSRSYTRILEIIRYVSASDLRETTA